MYVRYDLWSMPRVTTYFERARDKVTPKATLGDVGMSRDRSVIEKVIASLKNIGQFELFPLRESAHSACFKAVDPNRRISVSIRTVWPDELPNSEDYLRSVMAQARAAQALEHGNIAKVIGSGELDGAFFIVSSFVDGRILRQNLRSGEHLNTWDLIDFARQACVGLESAHARGLIHHALHPDNIVLEFDGSTKILDMGYFRANLPGVDAFHPNAVYLAPEQLAGHGADRMTNFYSVAIMLYEIATGKIPFTGESWEELAANAEAEIPEPIKVSPSVPAGINAAIVKALSRDRSARFQSGPELVRALEDYKAFGKPVAPVVPPKPVTPKVVAINTAAAGVGVRNPYATARDFVETADPRVEQQGSEGESRIGSDRPSLVGLQEAPGFWKQPSPQPPPKKEEEEEDFDAPFVEAPTKKALAKDASLRIAQQAWIATQRTAKHMAKRIDPWVAALSIFVIILGSFVTRTIALSFWGVPTSPDYGVSQPITPPANPAAHPARATQPPAAETSAQPLITADPTARTQRASAKKTAVVPPSATMFNAGRPLPPSGYTSAATGSVIVATTPAGARVVVDGNPRQAFTTPQAIPSLAPGVHTLTITKDGYAPATRPVQITAGAQSHLNVQLDLPSGFLTVLSSPSTAYILVDGVSTGHVTPSQVPVAPGTHTLSLRKFGYLEASDSFTVKSGEQQSRNVTLLEAGSTPEIRVAQTSGVKKMWANKVTGVRVTIRTTPPGATVAINGQTVPRNTPVDFGLNAGNYTMEVQLSGYQTLRKTITVQDGKPLTLDETLHP